MLRGDDDTHDTEGYCRITRGIFLNGGVLRDAGNETLVRIFFFFILFFFWVFFCTRCGGQPHCLALQMKRLKGFFALFPDFKKVRTPAARAEITRLVEISTLSAHRVAPGGVVAHSSSWTRVACELEEYASSEEASHEVLFQNFLMIKKKNVLRFRPLAGRREPGRCRNTGTEDFLLLPLCLLPPCFCASWSLCRCSGTSDRCSGRCGVTRASCCGSGNLNERRCTIRTSSSQRLECAAGHSVTDSESLTRCAPPGDGRAQVPPALLDCSQRLRTSASCSNQSLTTPCTGILS